MGLDRESSAQRRGFTVIASSGLSSGRVPGHRVGRRWKFKRAEVDEWVRAGRAAAATAATSGKSENE